MCLRAQFRSDCKCPADTCTKRGLSEHGGISRSRVRTTAEYAPWPPPNVCSYSAASSSAAAEAIRRLAGVIEERLELYRVFINAGALPGYGKEAVMAEAAPCIGR